MLELKIDGKIPAGLGTTLCVGWPCIYISYPASCNHAATLPPQPNARSPPCVNSGGPELVTNELEKPEVLERQFNAPSKSLMQCPA